MNTISSISRTKCLHEFINNILVYYNDLEPFRNNNKENNKNRILSEEQC